MQTETLVALSCKVLDEFKAVNITVLDVHAVSGYADALIVASGNSGRHVQALARHLLDAVRIAGVRPLGLEGERYGEWVLADLGDVVVHVMQPQVREFYQLEKLWFVPAAVPALEVAHE
jgi:ribosome-associated protein